MYLASAFLPSSLAHSVIVAVILIITNESSTTPYSKLALYIASEPMTMLWDKKTSLRRSIISRNRR